MSKAGGDGGREKKTRGITEEKRKDRREGEINVKDDEAKENQKD